MRAPRAPSDRPLVSIGMPVFRQEAYVHGAVRSVLAQHYEKIEVIISDDCSPDSTPQLCAALADTDPRVRFFPQERRLGHERNFDFVLREARGEFFMWFAGDDAAAPGLISTLLDVLEGREEAVAAMSAVDFIDASGRKTGQTAVPRGLHSEGGGPVRCPRRQFFSSRPMGAHFFLYGLFRVEDIRAAEWNYRGMVRFASAHEGPLLAQLSLRGELWSVPEPLKQYRQHRDSLFIQESSAMSWKTKCANKWNVARVSMCVACDSAEDSITRWGLATYTLASFLAWWLRFSMFTVLQTGRR